MRAVGFITIVILFIGGCKTSSVSTTTAEPYSEDLAVLRPDLQPEKEEVVVEIPAEKKSTKISGDIKAELDSVNKIIIQKNRSQRYVDGYTIQIYTGNDREAANEVMDKVATINPELEPTMEYYQPSYKVKVGQYVNRLKAHEIFESLKEAFPLALLIPERIRVDYD